MLFRVSIGLNILLIVIVAWGTIKMNFVKEQVLVTKAQHNLVEDANWSEPNLVTTKLGDVLNGIWLGMTTGK